MSNSANVNAGKPAATGAIFVAPLGTALPTDATTAKNVAFVELGYVSEDGVTNSNSSSSADIKAWGGDTVLSVQTSKTDTFNFTLLESLNPEVLKAVYGNNNVTGDLDNGGLRVVANSEEQEECSWVIDMVLRNGVLKRIVLPDAKVTNVDEISYVDNQAIGYNTTLSCLPDSTEYQATHYEYMLRVPSTSTMPIGG